MKTISAVLRENEGLISRTRNQVLDYLPAQSLYVKRPLTLWPHSKKDPGWDLSVWGLHVLMSAWLPPTLQRHPG